MAKILFALLIVSALFAIVCQAEPQRARYRQQRTRYLARQEADAVAPDAAPAEVTPYPSADELKPDVPFEEAGGATPDEVYGPPEQPVNTPDEVYGPPDVSENALPAEEPAAEPFPAPLDDTTARLIAARRRQAAYRQAAYRQAVAARARAAQPIKYRAAAVGPAVRRRA